MASAAISVEAGPAAARPAVEDYSPSQRRWATLFLMSGAVMNMVDTTVANVALPQMQGTTAASREEITWVLTSYMVAMAIATPLIGWLTARFSRKKVLVASVAGFTLFSLFCGISTTVEELVLFRVCQGFAGAAMIPLTQSSLLDIYPRHEHGKAMAIFGVAGVTGPLIGPVLGGWLTANFSWGWVFLVNLPIGAASVLGLLSTMRERPGRPALRFDYLGYGLLAVAIGSFQLMLDRGTILDWFDSEEILAEAVLAGASITVFVWISARSAHPFFPRGLLTDRNFVVGGIIALVASGVMMGTMAMLPELLAQLFGYPPLQIGELMAPRGLGTLVLTPFVPRIMRVWGPRKVMVTGLVIMAFSSFQMSWLSPQADGSFVVASGVFQGVGSSLLFTPLTVLTYYSIPENLRDDGAAMHILLRYLGSSIGISILQTLTSHAAIASHADLAGVVQLQNAPMVLRDMISNGAIGQAASAINGEVTRQAGMLAYMGTFTLLCIANLCIIPLVLLFRIPSRAASRTSPGAVQE